MTGVQTCALPILGFGSGWGAGTTAAGWGAGTAEGWCRPAASGGMCVWWIWIGERWWEGAEGGGCRIWIGGRWCEAAARLGFEREREGGVFCERERGLGLTEGRIYGWTDGRMLAMSLIHVTTDITNQSSSSKILFFVFLL